MGKWIVAVAVLFHLATGGQAQAATYSVKDGAAAGEFIIVLTNEIAVRGVTICFLLDPTDLSISTISAGQRLWLAWVFERNPGIRYTTGAPGRAESTQVWAG